MRSISLAILLVLAACKGKGEDKPAQTGSGSGSAVASKTGFGSGPSGSAAPTEQPAGSGKGSGSAGGEIPKDCEDWKAMVDKLMACDKMPEPQRKIMKDAYDQASSLWPTMPAASRAQLATSCRAGADAIMSSAKATCGW